MRIASNFGIVRFWKWRMRRVAQLQMGVNVAKLTDCGAEQTLLPFPASAMERVGNWGLCFVCVMPNVRAKRATTAERQGPG